MTEIIIPKWLNSHRSSKYPKRRITKIAYHEAHQNHWNNRNNRIQQNNNDTGKNYRNNGIRQQKRS